MPILVEGQQVGTLLIPAASGVHESLESEFLDQVNRTLLWAGLAAGAVALVVGLLLARQLTAPLRALTEAAHDLAEGETPQVEVTSRDEIGELARAFNQMSRSLAHQETLRRNLMADIAHELRTPLTVIRGDLEALLDGVFEPTPETLASLQEETLLLSRLVDDLRALAQAEAGQLQLQRQPTDLVDLCRASSKVLTCRPACQGQTLRLEAAPDLPPVDADPQRVRQIVANLVSNALRHAPDSGQVVVSALQRSGEVVDLGGRRRAWHLSPGPAPRVRPLLAGRAAPRRGQRPGTGHRPRAGARPRRADLGRERAGPGQHLFVHAAACPERRVSTMISGIDPAHTRGLSAGLGLVHLPDRPVGGRQGPAPVRQRHAGRLYGLGARWPLGRGAGDPV